MSDAIVMCYQCATVIEEPKWYISSNPHWGIMRRILCDECAAPNRSIIYYNTREAAELARVKGVL